MDPRDPKNAIRVYCYFIIQRNILAEREREIIIAYRSI